MLLICSPLIQFALRSLFDSLKCEVVPLIRSRSSGIIPKCTVYPYMYGIGRKQRIYIVVYAPTIQTRLTFSRFSKNQGSIKLYPGAETIRATPLLSRRVPNRVILNVILQASRVVANPRLCMQQSSQTLLSTYTLFFSRNRTQL